MEKENKNFPKIVEVKNLCGNIVKLKQFRDLNQMKTEEAFKLFQKYHAGLSLKEFQKKITNFEFVQDMEKEKNRLLTTLNAFIKVRDNINRDQAEYMDFCAKYKKSTPYVSSSEKVKSVKERVMECEDSIADVYNKLIVVKFIDSFEKISAENKDSKPEKER